MFNRTMVFLLIFITTGFSQFANRKKDRKELRFDVKCVNLIADEPSLSRLGIVIKIPNQSMQYKKNRNEFTSRVMVSIEIIGKDDELVELKDMEKTMTTEDFNETLKREFISLNVGNFDLLPEEYKVRVRLFDRNSQLNGLFEKKLTLRNFNPDTLTASHILFTNTQNPYNRDYRNTIFDFRGKTPDSLFAYIEFMVPAKDHGFNVEYQIGDESGAVSFSSVLTMSVTQGKQRVFLPIDPTALSRGWNRLIVRYSSGDKSKLTDIRFHNDWKNAKLSAGKELKITLRQLDIIADSKSYRKIKKVPVEERDSLINEYWRQIDPTPSTGRNELKEEFERRIREANRMFGVNKKEGWDTDRGRIYLKYGPPDRTEQAYQNQSGFSQYIVWYYESLRLQFVFFDKHGFGDYRRMS